MKIKKKMLIKDNGSTLIIVLFLLFILSTTAIAVIALTSSELGMSVVNADSNRALLVAQAGAESAAQHLDEQVALIQDQARVKSTEIIKAKIDTFKVSGAAITAPFDVAIDNSNPSEIRVIDEEALNDIYYNEYKYQFYTEFNTWLSKQTITNAIWNSTQSHYLTTSALSIEEKEKEGTYSYTTVSAISGSELLSAVSGDMYPINSIRIITQGKYKSTNGTTYSRKVEAEFGLLTSKNSGGTTDIPVSYGKLTKVRVNSNNKPEILKNKALIAQGNIISIEGTTEITGDAISFGTFPVSPLAEDRYKSDVSGYEYGGIMAGVLKDTPIGIDRNNLNGTLIGYKSNLEIDDAFLNKNHTGSFKFNNNVSTLSYIHSLYSEEDNPSTIDISKGDAYARAFKIEELAHFSETNLKNIYLTDDLRIDASEATVNVGKTGDLGELFGISTGAGSKYSSSVGVLGDSKLNINGSIYMGGSTYYNDYYLSTDNKMYPSGFSVQKSGKLPGEAFETMGTDLLSTPSKDIYPGNVFYLYNNTPLKDYTYVNNPGSNTSLLTESYKKNMDATNAAINVEMMKGVTFTDGRLKEDPFSIVSRAMHIKYIWDNFWSKDLMYQTYLNTGDIKISTNGDKINGWCYGAVGANNKIYGPYFDFTINDGGTTYGIKADNATKSYKSSMAIFIDNNIEVTTPQKLLSSHVIKSELPQNKPIMTSGSGIVMLYSTDNVILGDHYLSGTSGDSQSITLPGGDKNRGIIYSNKDIYVKDGTNFKGMLIAEGNIVFIGSSEITYDEDTVDLLMNEEPRAGKFFKYRPSDILLNSNSEILTIKKANVKNIKIINWKEI